MDLQSPNLNTYSQSLRKMFLLFRNTTVMALVLNHQISWWTFKKYKNQTQEMHKIRKVKVPRKWL